ncbi:MAG: hypothetical protein PHS09_00545 [Candidatus Omnitrophica bacterium]|jgi:hypothetical protein|nr:hypothetical protein [Candidatus Omnitrophota bacterium]
MKNNNLIFVLILLVFVFVSAVLIHEVQFLKSQNNRLMGTFDQLAFRIEQLAEEVRCKRIAMKPVPGDDKEAVASGRKAKKYRSKDTLQPGKDRTGNRGYLIRDGEPTIGY